jgi:TatD DNase family protein
MITIGASPSPQANARAVGLAERYPQIFATVGVHPHTPARFDDPLLHELTRLARGRTRGCIGKTGLDYHYEHIAASAAQREAFFADSSRWHVRFSDRWSFILRAADDDALALLREEHAHDIGGVIHCFSSDARSARAFLDLGFYLSFSGIVTFKKRR